MCFAVIVVVVVIAGFVPSTDVPFCLGPRVPGDAAAGGPSIQVTLLEVDATIAPGEAGLVGGLAERWPVQR